MFDINLSHKKFLKNMNFNLSLTNNRYHMNDQEKPESGQVIIYEQRDRYLFYMADFIVQKAYEDHFEGGIFRLRFGVFHDGRLKYNYEDGKTTSFSPSSYLIREHNLVGKTYWQTGQSHKGSEFIFSEDYLLNVLALEYSDVCLLKNLTINHRYNYLPLEVVKIIEHLTALSLDNRLTSMYLDAKALECLSLIIQDLKLLDSNFKKEQRKVITRSKAKNIQLSDSDLGAVHTAQQIIFHSIAHPPTVSTLSKMVYLSEAKLNAGFKVLFHQSIGQYIKDLRMTTAANMLVTSDLTIESISIHLGYSHPSNFVKVFKQKYKKTPLQYRKSN